MLLANNTSFNFHHTLPSAPPPSSSSAPTSSTSPAQPHYPTSPASRKRFRFGGGCGGGVRSGATNGRNQRSSDLFTTFQNYNERDAHSPPPLSSFYDTPIDGSLTVAEEPETNNLFSDYRRDGGFMTAAMATMTTSRKRGFSETLEDNEYYESGRMGPGDTGMMVTRKNANEKGGGKRRIIDMVGSVASKVWEICKVSTSGILSFPGALLGAAAGDGGVEIIGEKEELHYESVERGIVDGIYENPITPLVEEVGYYEYPSKSDLRNETGPFAPELRRRSSSHSSRGNLGSSPVISSLDGGLQAQWVFVSPYEDESSNPRAASSRPSSSRSHITRRTTGKPVGHIRTGSGTVSASSSTLSTKRRPFRFPAKTIVGFSGNSGGNTAPASPRKLRKGRGHGSKSSNFGAADDCCDDDEVDESIRRFNEQLKAMIREGKEALGSKVEVVYEDDLVDVY